METVAVFYGGEGGMQGIRYADQRVRVSGCRGEGFAEGGEWCGDNEVGGCWTWVFDGDDRGWVVDGGVIGWKSWDAVSKEGMVEEDERGTEIYLADR
jgi:hypothetical protein